MLASFRHELVTFHSFTAFFARYLSRSSSNGVNGSDVLKMALQGLDVTYVPLFPIVRQFEKDITDLYPRLGSSSGPKDTTKDGTTVRDFLERFGKALFQCGWSFEGLHRCPEPTRQLLNLELLEGAAPHSE